MSFKSCLLSTMTISTLALGACAPIPSIKPNHPDYQPVAVPVAQEQPVTNGSIFQSGKAVYLYRDRKANQIGDIITVVLSERTQASKNADTEITKDNSISMANPILFGRPVSIGFDQANLEMTGTQTRAFTSAADSEQNNRLEGTITVTVSQVLPNGNLIVKGEKWITLNQGDEFIRLKGIIRPEDINADNTVLSGKVANAQISYSGTGALASSNQQGWLARFFNSVFWPF